MFERLKNIFKAESKDVPASEAKSATKPLDEAFYQSAMRVSLKGRLTMKDLVQLVNLGALMHGHARVVIELDSMGCDDERTLGILRGVLRKLCEDTDVRMIARGTCASSAMFIMNSVPPNCRYGTPGVKMWIDAGNFPGEIRKSLTPGQLKVADEKFSNGYKQPFTMEQALGTKMFGSILDVDWLD